MTMTVIGETFAIAVKDTTRLVDREETLCNSSHGYYRLCGRAGNRFVPPGLDVTARESAPSGILRSTRISTSTVRTTLIALHGQRDGREREVGRMIAQVLGEDILAGQAVVGVDLDL